jgi:hypothetical protein
LKKLDKPLQYRQPGELMGNWKGVLAHAIPITLFIIGLFYYWFALADRYDIFLYNHLVATAFDERTNSRYWMSGLVACGVVLVLYIIVNWFLGRIAGLRYRKYFPPSWWRVWLLCVIPLVISIPFITMTFNQPTLPFYLAGVCTIITLLGLALAVSPGVLAAQRPFELGSLVMRGIGLLPSLLLLRVIELPSRGLVSVHTAYSVVIGGMLAGIIWLILITWVQAHWYGLCIGTKEIFVAGLCLSYLVMPLLHYLLFVPPEFRYISASTNFFAFNESTQLMSFIVAAILAKGSIILQRKWVTH